MTPLLLLIYAASSVHCQAITETKHIAAFVDMHNRLRRSVFPPAMNMTYVTWSAALATNAASAECGYPDIAFNQHNGNGRNYFKDTTREDDVAKVRKIIGTSVAKWFMNKTVYIYENNACPSATKESCDAFRLIISPALSEIGCAVKKDCNTTGYHQYLCLYDTLFTDSSTPIYKAGVSGSGCAGTGNTTEASGFSLGGLCLMTASQTAKLNRNKREHSYCEFLTCKNCATDQNKDENYDTGICRCSTCLSGYSGADCSIKGNKAAAPDCGLCQQQGTPCLNNGVDKSANGKCICDCGTTGRAGPQCEMRKDEYDNAVYLEVSSSISNDPLPADPLYMDVIRSMIRHAVHVAVNAFCVSSNITNVAKCCNETKPKAAPTDVNFAIDVRESGLTPNGNLGYAIDVQSNNPNNMCETKPNHTYTVPLEVLVESLNTAGFATDVTNTLSHRDCGDSKCNFKIVADSVRSYKGFADDKYGIKTPDSIRTTNGPQTDGNKDTTTAAAAADPGTTKAGVFLALLLILLLLVLATAFCQVKQSLRKPLV